MLLIMLNDQVVSSHNAKAANPKASIPATPIAKAGSWTSAPLLDFAVEPLLDAVLLPPVVAEPVAVF